LAGIRIGVAIANKKIINELEKVRLPYNINSISQLTASFALKNRKIILSNINKIIIERKRLFDELNKINKVFLFQTNSIFILFRVAGNNADVIYDYLKNKGILVRNLNENGILKNCLRVTVGTRTENNKFLEVMKKYENENSKGK
jgi:histidinol-phosphate aminotransferase